MKKFKFGLAAALKFRESQFQIERTKLQQLFGEEQSLKNAVVELAANRREAAAFIHGSKSVDAVDLRALATFSVGADARAVSLQQDLSRQEKVIQQQKAKVMQAERRVKLLAKLRDQKFATWRHEVDREIELAAQESWLSKRHFEISRHRSE